VYVCMSCNKSEDNTRHRAYMFMHYVHTHTHTHEPTHTPTHKIVPGLGLPCLIHPPENRRVFPPPTLHSKFSLNHERRWARSVTLVTSERARQARAEVSMLPTQQVYYNRTQKKSFFFFFIFIFPHFFKRMFPLPTRRFSFAQIAIILKHAGASRCCFANNRLLLCPLFPWPFRGLLAFLCCCSADILRAAPAVAALLNASIRLRGLSPRPIRAGVGNLPRRT
jgi:hypothetical protein